MDYQNRDSDGELSKDGIRVEQDFTRPLRPMKSVSHRRLPAALPIAIAGLLVLSSVAFGATVMHSIAPPQGSASPIAVGDDNPTDTPTVVPTTETQRPKPSQETVTATQAPTATPAPGELALTAQSLPGKVKLTWSVFTGEGFAYYKVVRSTDATVAWPLGDGDSVLGVVEDHSTVIFFDPCGAGTFTYRVFAVKSAALDYQLLAASPARTVAVTAATAAPTVTPPPVVTNPADLGPLHVTDNGDGKYTFSWSAYTGSIDYSWYKLDGQPYPNTPGYVENNGDYWSLICKGTTTTTIPVSPGTWNIVVEAVYYPGGVATSAGKTSVIKLVVPARSTPTLQPISLSGDGQSDGIHLSWSCYSGANFAYYKVVRSESNSEPTWPLSSGDALVKAIPYVDTLSLIDSAAVPGHTYHYRVYVWNGTNLGVSNVVTVTMPTPPPSTAPGDSPTA